jgi:hypothetical protein
MTDGVGKDSQDNLSRKLKVIRFLERSIPRSAVQGR